MADDGWQWRGWELSSPHSGGAKVTTTEFRRMALSLPETSEVGHMGHPDFRVRGKIFATLGYPSEAWGVVKLTPKQQ
jgi:hypothetical protein